MKNQHIKNITFDLDGVIFEKEVDANGHLPVKKGTQEMMVWLRFHRFGVGLTSCKTEEEIGRILEEAHIGEYFDQGISIDQVENAKPDPETYQMARQELGEVMLIKAGLTEEEAHAVADPVMIYAVESTYDGLKSAHDAGCFTIMILNEKHVTTEVAEVSDKIFPSLDELREWLDQLEQAQWED